MPVSASPFARPLGARSDSAIRRSRRAEERAGRSLGQDGSKRRERGGCVEPRPAGRTMGQKRGQSRRRWACGSGGSGASRAPSERRRKKTKQRVRITGLTIPPKSPLHRCSTFGAPALASPSPLSPLSLFSRRARPALPSAHPRALPPRSLRDGQGSKSRAPARTARHRSGRTVGCSEFADRATMEEPRVASESSPTGVPESAASTAGTCGVRDASHESASQVSCLQTTVCTRALQFRADRSPPCPSHRRPHRGDLAGRWRSPAHARSQAFRPRGL